MLLGPVPHASTSVGPRAWRRLGRLLVVTCVALVLVGSAACSDDDPAPVDSARVDETAADEDPVPTGDAPTDEAPPDDAPQESGPPVAVDCSAEGLGEDDTTTFEVAHTVEDGELGPVCFGEEDERLLVAWDDLVAITPPAQLNDLALFAGFAASEDGDEETLAFVNATDDEGEAFQMSVNLDAYADDDTTALLTIAHEFAHVFTQGPSQIDRSDAAFEECTTYQSSAGCFAPDSLIATWVAEFWSDDLLASLDPDVEPTVAEGEDRCAADPSFLGAYAASDPEEDFAESFSAYVFDVPVDRPEVQAKIDWMAAQPGLVEFRERAEAAGLTPLDDVFDPCG